VKNGRAGLGQGRRTRGDRHRAQARRLRFEKQDDAVEGVILLRTGVEHPGRAEWGSRPRPTELNSEILPKDVKSSRSTDRKRPDKPHHPRGPAEPARGMLLVVVVLIFFLYDLRAGLIVATTTIPWRCCLPSCASTCTRLRQPPTRSAAIDFGILVDGAVVMVENIFRQLACARENRATSARVIKAAAAEVDRPIFYAVRVIVRRFPAIYVLTWALRAALQADGRPPWSSR